MRGTKNPNRAAIAALRPDLVLANREENRELDVQRLRDAGIAVWVTVIETVDEAFASMERMFTEALGWDSPRVAGRGPCGVGRAGTRLRSPGGDPDLAGPVDGGRRAYVHG